MTDFTERLNQFLAALEAEQARRGAHPPPPLLPTFDFDSTAKTDSPR